MDHLTADDIMSAGALFVAPADPADWDGPHPDYIALGEPTGLRDDDRVSDYQWIGTDRGDDVYAIYISQEVAI